LNDTCAARYYAEIADRERIAFDLLQRKNQRA